MPETTSAYLLNLLKGNHFILIDFKYLQIEFKPLSRDACLMLSLDLG